MMHVDTRVRFLRPTTRVSFTQSLRPFLCTGLLAAICSSGCQGFSSSEPTYEVKGKVFLSNGKALKSGRVTFVSADRSLPEVSGDIQADGGFALTTRSPGDGAVPGKYKVRIEPFGRKDPRKPKLSFPAKYVDEDSSGLEVTVQAQANQLEPFTLR